MVHQPIEVHPDHRALPCWHDRTSHLKEQSVWSFQDLQWGEARLCPGTSPLQLVLHLHAHLHCTGYWWRGVYPLPLWWFHFTDSQPSQRLTDPIQAALFADYYALMAHKSSDMQTMLSRFSDASKLFGLTIKLGKTEVFSSQHQTAVPLSPPSLSVAWEMKTVKSFKYLGSIISSDGQLDKEISVRISKESQALWRLHNRVLTHHNVSLTTKLKVYRAVVLTSLLYGCEFWTIYEYHIRQLEKFHMQALHSILAVWWHDRITNLKVLDQANSISIKVMLPKAQLCWAGHIIWMGDEHIP